MLEKKQSVLDQFKPGVVNQQTYIIAPEEKRTILRGLDDKILAIRPTIRTEVSVTWYRDPGCERSPSKQAIQTIFCEKRQFADWLVENLFKGSDKSRSKESRLQNGKQIFGKERKITKRT